MGRQDGVLPIRTVSVDCLRPPRTSTRVESSTRSRSTCAYPFPVRRGGPLNWGRTDPLRNYPFRGWSLWTEPSGSGVLSRAPLGQPRFRMLLKLHKKNHPRRAGREPPELAFSGGSRPPLAGSHYRVKVSGPRRAGVAVCRWRGWQALANMECPTRLIENSHSGTSGGSSAGGKQASL